MLLIEVGGVLILLALLARLAARTGFSPIPLYLLAGLVTGAIAPRDLDATTVEIGTQIAVILLLFMLGLEYVVDDVVTSLRSSYVAGVLDAALNFPPGFLAGLAMGWDWLPALVLGGVTYISSSSIIAKVLDDLGRLGNSETPGMLAVLVLEDLVMAPYLPFVAILLAGGTVLESLAWAAGACALAAVALTLARHHGPSLSRGLSHPKSEVVLLSIMGLLLIAGGVAELLRVSGGVIAFLVGLSISGSIAQRARELLAPLRDLFAALFFMSFGFMVDETAILGVLGAALALWAITSLTKVVTGWIAVRATSGVAGRLRAGTALVARGEFSIVIAGLAVTAGGVDRRLAPLAAVYVLLTAVTAPLLTRYAGSLALRVSRGGHAAEPAEPPG
ncbi:MAG TPA: cation:proton antiporter [Thermoleophilia bacterium]|nr:cation:proton antiporter [Thermoleophilia bacterium]HQJ98480.1 cation:proton antiporter [Thermoleophilia bacterium]